MCSTSSCRAGATGRQQNAALVEEAAAAAGSLEEQAGKLETLISVFKVDNAQIAGAARVPTAMAPSPRPALAHRTTARAPLRRAGPTLITAKASDWEEF